MPPTFFRLLSVFTVLLIPVSGLSQQYEFRSFDTGNGLPQPYIYSLTQDSAGHLWIGTGEGLSKFDGFDFRVYNTLDSLSDTFITCSFSSRDRIFFGHMNGTVSVFDGRNFKRIYAAGRSLTRITCISAAPDGSLWASTLADGFFRIDPSSYSLSGIVSAGDEMVNTFLFTDNDELIAGTNSGLMKYSREGDKVLTGLPGSKITSVIKGENSDEYIVASENDGIYRVGFNGEKPEIKSFALGTDVKGIQGICQGQNSDLWVATFGSGLVRFSTVDGGTAKISLFNRLTGYPSDNVKTVWKDREGVIWGGNFGEGLTRIIPRSALLSDFGPVYGAQVFSVVAGEGFVWTGTGKGLLKTEMQTGRILNKGVGDLPSDTVSALFRSGGIIWAGTGRHGIFRISENTGRTVSYRLGNGSLENSVTSISGGGSRVFAGTRKGLCEIDTATGQVTRYTISDGLPHNFINGLWYDREGTLWITTKSNIISYLEDGRIHKLPVNLASGMITAGPVTGDWGNTIWVGTSGQGILVLGMDSVMNITTREGLLSDYCYSVSCDGRYIWVGHRGGLSRIDTGDLTIKHVTRFGEHDDLQFGVNAAASIPGRAFFGTDRGLATYDINAELPVSEPFLPYITSLRINDDEFDPGVSSVNLPTGRYRLRIQFLAVSLKSPDMVRYQTYLEGYDEEWSEVSKSNVVIYNRLTGGKYRLLLRSFNSDGIVARTPLSLDIVINLPPWKRWWFFPVLVLLLGSIVLYYLKWKERQHRQEKRVLEERVKERTSEIERQKNELAAQRDEIDEKNLSIMSSITYARQIQKAILPPREVLDRSFPENFVLHKPKDIVSGDFYWMAERNNRIVFSVADCTGHGVPGAFMSLLGITLLNEIVNVNGIIQSDIIVTELRRRLVQSIQQSKSGIQTYDGMDISLCVFDPEKRKLQFTGGMNHMVKIRDGKLEVIRADRLDVSASHKNQGTFNVREVDCITGDMIYLFSDGYQDQFGGEYNKKFLRPHFYTTLVEVHRLPAEEQKEALETKLMNWMKNHPQTDDITILGIKMC
jgi:serine phosphatase RsbU (regulator of sigma subunit)/ligand-binding sensor domain-containing protein